MMNIISLNRITAISLIFCLGFCLMSCGNEGSTTSKSKVKAVKGTTESGYPYVHYIQNKGPKPVIGDEVRYQEVVIKNDSLVRSSNLQTEPVRAIMPTKEKVATPPPPSYEALFKMAVGDSLEVLHLLDTFKNFQLPGWLKPTDTLKYTLTLLSLRPKSEVDAESATVKAQETEVATTTKALIQDYKAGKLESQLKKTESGLKYIIHEEGTGKQPVKNKLVEVHYSGFLMNGEGFDNSFSKGTAFPFYVGRKNVIEGWDEGIPLMKEGGKATFFIPYQLAYGEAGRPPKIPEKSELVFYVELLSVK